MSRSICCSLRQVLLQSEDELLVKRTSELTNEGAPTKPKKTIGKIKVQGNVHGIHKNLIVQVAMDVT